MFHEKIQSLLQGYQLEIEDNHFNITQPVKHDSMNTMSNEVVRDEDSNDSDFVEKTTTTK